MTHRTLTGRIRYTSTQPERDSHERGRETWTITVHQDGRRTLQALSEIDDAPNVLRHVTLSVDADHRPTDAFVRVSVGDHLVGSSWFRFSETMAECEGFTAAGGRVSQRIDLDAPLGAFGTHPLQGDAWVFAQLPFAAGPAVTAVDMLLSSLDHRGATGPELAPLHQRITFVGRERVTVKAGTFDAFHIQLGADDQWEADDALRHPPYDAWVSADGDYLLLKAKAGGYMQTAYELVELDRRPSSK